MIISIAEGYKLIKKDKNSNVGWRIVLDNDIIESFKDIIRQSLDGKPIINFLPKEYISKHIKKISEMVCEDYKKSRKSLQKKIRIKLTTYLGAKGLSANHVFVLGLENGVFPENKDNISDHEACQFIVLLTRAKKSLHLLVVNRYINKSKRSDTSSFISMILGSCLDLREKKLRSSDFNGN